MGADDAILAARQAAWRGDGLSLVEKLRSAAYTHLGAHDNKACKADSQFVATGDHVMPSPDLLAEAAEALAACHEALAGLPPNAASEGAE